jgi:hypothetical protein
MTDIKRLAEKIGEIQMRALDAISRAIESAAPDFEKAQLGDMAEVIRLDLSSRASLDAVRAVILRVEVTEETYRVFADNASAVIKVLDEVNVPAEAMRAFEIVKREMDSGRRLPLSDIFTVTSALVTTVALITLQMGLEELYFTANKLDKLLEIKMQQLELLKQFARFNGDFVS